MSQERDATGAQDYDRSFLEKSLPKAQALMITT